MFRTLALVLTTALTLAACGPSEFAQALKPTKCIGPNLEIDFPNEISPQISAVTSARFLSETIVQLRVWMPSKDGSANKLIGFDSELYLVNLSLDSHKVEWIQNTLHPIRQVCTTCKSHVLDESPSKRWQLIEVRSSDRTKNGLWLVSKQSTTRLAEFLPIAVTWQWGNNDHFLLVNYPEREYGSVDLWVQLNKTPSPTIVTLPTHTPSPSYALNPKTNELFAGAKTSEMYRLVGWKLGQITSTPYTLTTAKTGIVPFWNAEQQQMLTINMSDTVGVVSDLFENLSI